MTRWLASTCDEELNEKDQWEKLIIFLEKEMRLQQQKSILQPQRTRNEDEKSQEKGSQPKMRYKSFLSNYSDDPVCHFCEGSSTEEHVATRGPGGSKIFQYYSCKSFVDKSPGERFAILKRKEMCFQCLFPGARQSDWKHKDGKCQHDFTCKHPSHQQWPIKKHVLVCEEHKSSEENKKQIKVYLKKHITSKFF